MVHKGGNKMNFVKSVGKYDIYAASENECAQGYMNIAFEYPCFCVFDKSERTLNLETSEGNFASLAQAVEWCNIFA